MYNVCNVYVMYVYIYIYIIDRRRQTGLRRGYNESSGAKVLYGVTTR